MTRVLNNCAAPAKLNLFLHVVGRRADGYHLLQSVFQLIDRGDVLHFSLRDDEAICRSTELAGVPAESDLVIRAARLLQTAIIARGANTPAGVDIAVEKKLPMGGGLGGGSSDAATTLLALNHLWQAGFSREELMQIGVKLGADVPFFIFGRNAFVEGIGEAMQAVYTPSRWFVVIEPGVSVPTQQIFAETGLTRDTKVVKIADFLGAATSFGKNDLQVVAEKLFPPIADAVKWLQQFGEARMTGSGACVFCGFTDERQADAALDQVPAQWKAWKARALDHHPLAQLLQS
ncbi:MAG: 4-(cytidine 5'-diphospho)-2-C-methyl-D-erythritol kinase [Oxalicibacterium faecigallinarum]|uniref:4-(cytidine 5'-diphospho)-2-C-methyl-D-erythritol kinase n=1 Tax=Oxalicibacterium faecigallinarum TaxID=573741 RepID=UPI002806A62B|nr:4-(cytidine 5'-diphospho)-2-C-methyl-D-erythritol kinase [Oxalicibacterium faecigallinarum]MDQ7968504.1 4-(cytidine 5'-diphospho)-2-C-methyl-D-erythritol kinase [Oxalicibacterium faecigallinarum]